MYSTVLMSWGYVREDTQVALLVGGLMGIALAVIFTIFPGSPIKMDVEPEPEEKLEIDDAKLTATSERAEKVLGIPKEAFKKAVEDATDEVNTKGAVEPWSAFPVIPFAVALGLAIALATRDSDARWLDALARFFPTEARVLRAFVTSSPPPIAVVTSVPPIVVE